MGSARPSTPATFGGPTVTSVAETMTKATAGDTGYLAALFRRHGIGV
jgi:hypothetical protein